MPVSAVSFSVHRMDRLARALNPALVGAAIVIVLLRALLEDEHELGREEIEEKALFIRSSKGDSDAREQLITRYLPLAHRLARRYWYGREPLDDLLQVAGMGLVKAIDRFDPARGMMFPAYAVPTILGELKRHFRDNGWALHVPQRVQARAFRVERATDDLRRQLGRSPSLRELSEATGVGVQDVEEAVEAAASAFEAVSLDSSRRSGGEESSESFEDALGTEDERYELIEYGASIQPALKALPPRERLILYLRFVEDLTQCEIGKLMGISQMHVSRLLRRALARLRTVANANA
jgi:RNA polymerase sigma-B factor